MTMAGDDPFEPLRRQLRLNQDQIEKLRRTVRIDPAMFEQLRRQMEGFERRLPEAVDVRALADKLAGTFRIDPEVYRRLEASFPQPDDVREVFRRLDVAGYAAAAIRADVRVDAVALGMVQQEQATASGEPIELPVRDEAEPIDLGLLFRLYSALPAKNRRELQTRAGALTFACVLYIDGLQRDGRAAWFGFIGALLALWILYAAVENAFDVLEEQVTEEDDGDVA